MKNILHKVLLYLILTALLLAASGEWIAAAEELPREDALVNIAASNPEDARQPMTARPNVDATYHKDFEYSSDIILDGVFQTNSYYFQIENYWDYRYAFAEIQIDVSQLISNVPASLTFMVNDTPVVSYLIDYANGRSQTFYVSIPTRLLRDGYNSFAVTGYARIYDEDGCLDDFTGANWVSIRKESYIQIGYELMDHQRSISYFPYPFISSIDSTGAGSYVAVSDSMSNQELAAALALRAELSRKTDHEDRIQLITERNMPASADGIILISEYDHLSPENKARVDAAATEDQLADHALVLFQEDRGTPLMLITSRDAECLMEAAAMLMDDERVRQEKGSAALVEKGGIEQMQDALAENMTASGRYTLEDLMEGGIEFIGPFHQEAFIYLPYSGGFVLSESSKIVLNYRYSENLNFDRSMITVYWGDVPVASKKLTLEGAGGDELSFMMPRDVIGTHADSIRIAFELELPELFCTPRMDEMPWAYVSNESVFYLPMGVNTQYKFDLRPYPFEQNSVYNDLVVVIPEQIADYELEALSHLLTAYGISIEPYGDIQIVRAGELTDALRKHHLIVFGTYQSNPEIQRLNEYLGFVFKEDGSAYESNHALILSDSYAREIVTLQLFNSPYEENRAVLVCSTANRENFTILSDFLEDEEKLWTLAGDTVLIDGDLEVKAFNLQDRIVEQRTPVLRRLMDENRDTMIFTIVSLSAMLLLLLAVVLIFIRVYWNQRGKK